MFPVYLVQLFCVASLVIVFRNGETVQSRLNDYKYVHRAKRAMTPAMKVLAWRKLLWNSKPSAMTSRNGYAGYHKEGDFSNARDDFLSVVPNAKMIYDARGKKVFEGVVGDRHVVLRERGGLNKEYPTIEITKGDSTDKIFYMGKGWNRIFYKRKQ